MTASAEQSVPSRIAGFVERNVFVVLVLCGMAIVLVVLARDAVKTDGWYTLLAGRLIVETGLPRHDTLAAMTLGRDWADQQWLSQLWGYGLWSAGGWQLALTVSALCFLSAFAIAAGTARLRGASERSTALILIAALLLGLPNTVFRTQIPAYVLFATVLALLVTDQSARSRRVYLVFPLLILWANVHGSVVLGAGLVALYGVVDGITSSRRPRTAILVLAPWACVLASPYALDLPGYYRHMLWNPALGHAVSEWARSTPWSQPVFYVVLLLVAVVVLRTKRLTAFEQLALLATALGGVLAIRNIIWFAFVVAALAPGALDALWTPKSAPRRRTVNLVLAGAGIAAVCIGFGQLASRNDSYFERDFPAAIAATAAAQPPQPVLASDAYGDWLLFQEPSLRSRVAFDARYELLTSSELDRLADFFSQNGSGWRAAGAGYRLFVVNRKQGPTAKQLGGTVIARSGDVLLVRRRGS